MPEEAVIVRFSSDVKSAVAGVKEVSLTLKEQQAILQKLKLEYAYLDAAQRKSAFGKQMASDIRIASAEVANLKSQSVGLSGALTKSLGPLRTLANILPGIGIAGLFTIAFDGLQKLFASMDSAKGHAQNFISAFEGAKNKFVDVTKNVFELRAEIDLAKQGFISKEGVVKHYNETIGKTTGIVHSLDEAEQGLVKNGDAYIEMTLKKALAEVAATKAAESLFKAAEIRVKLRDEISNIPGTAGAYWNVEGIAVDKATKKILAARKEAEDFKKIMADALKDAASFGFNFFQDTKAGKLIINKSNLEELFQLPARGEIIKGSLDLKRIQLVLLNNLPKTFKEQFEEKISKALEDIVVKPNIDPGRFSNSKGLKDLQDKAKKDLQELQVIGENIAGVMTSAFDGLFESISNGTDAIKGFFQGMVQGLANVIKKLIEAAAISGILSLLGLGSFGDIFKNMIGLVPKRAAGGPVTKGNPYLINERLGGELFIPSQSGRIIPNNQLSGLQGSAVPTIIFNGRLAVTGQELQLLLNRTDRYNRSNV